MQVTASKLWPIELPAPVEDHTLSFYKAVAQRRTIREIAARPLTLAGKVAFVTGAGNGIGRAAALVFAREGAGVVVADISEQDNQQTARMIEQAGGRALAVGWRRDAGRRRERRGGKGRRSVRSPRDCAFNNAGVEQPITPAADLTQEQWDRIVDIESTDYLRLAFAGLLRHFWRRTLARRRATSSSTAILADIKGG
jgi:NAD(P)-dependent dehydrogenase (short-subunit alcohol dehydrogenase family)